MEAERREIWGQETVTRGGGAPETMERMMRNEEPRGTRRHEEGAD